MSGLSHVYFAEGLSNTGLSQGRVLRAIFGRGKTKSRHIPRTGSGVRRLDCWGPAFGSASNHVLSVTFPTDIHTQALLVKWSSLPLHGEVSAGLNYLFEVRKVVIHKAMADFISPLLCL